MPTRTGGPVTVSNPYWSAAGARVVRIEIARAALPELTLPPPARCLNASVRPAPEKCPQDTIVKNVEAVIANDEAWKRCLPNGAPGFADDVVQVLPHRAGESGALRTERTYTRGLATPAMAGPSRMRATAPALDVEFVSLLPGATVCMNKDHSVGAGDWPWISSAQSCVRLLDSFKGSGSVVLSRTDTENTFPLAYQVYEKDQSVVFDARSWLAVRGALAALMPQGAFLYVYYSGEANAPDEDLWESGENGSVRWYPITSPKSILPLSPVLVAHSEPLRLTSSSAPDLDVLCRSGGVPKVVRRCFAFRDFASIDVLRPYVVNGQVDYAPSGTLTSDVPGLDASRGVHATRVFRGRRVSMAFDVLNPRNAVPLAADDQLKGIR